MAEEKREQRPSGTDGTPATSAPAAPRGAALSEGVAGGPKEAGATPMAADPGGRAAPPSGDGTEPRDADSPAEAGPRDHAGGRDAIDRARDEEVQDRDETEGAAFPNPGGGAVVAPQDDEERDPATEHPDEGRGAGDEMRGGGSGPVPPGTGRPLPGTGRRDERVAAEDDFTREELSHVDPTARATAYADGPIPGDGPTAREAEPAARGGSADAGAMHAMGVEAGRNGWVLWVLGIAAIVAGIIALAMPLVASLATNAVVAAMLLVSGAVGFFTSFKRRDGGAIAIGFALSALAVITGVVMLIAPIAGIVALSTVIVAFFLASGAMKVWYGVKSPEMRGRGWLIASGALSIVLALVLWLAFPASALWLPGVLLAIDLILYGALMISLAVFGKPKLDAERMA